MSDALVFFGAPGAGKGTQCSLLAKKKGWLHVSTGSILRAEVATGSALGREIDKVSSQGNLVSDELLFNCLEAYLKRVSQPPLIMLDGVPRNVTQVPSLIQKLNAVNVKIIGTIVYSIDQNMLVERFSKRVVCKNCDSIFSVDSPESLGDLKCDNCGSVGLMYRRVDDSPEVVVKRLKLYESVTFPALAELKKIAPVKEVVAEGSAEEISVQTLLAIESIL
jgi:adenylate kinase